MIRKIAGTALTRVLNAVIMLAVLFIATNNLGAEAYGSVTFVILGITITGLVNHFVGGGALVYYIPRKPLMLLLIPSYLWAVFSAVAVILVLDWFGKIPHQFVFHVIIIAMLQSLASINQNVMLGKERIKHFNLISLVQFALLLSTLSLMIFAFKNTTALAYVLALYAAYGGAFVLSVVLILKDFLKLSMQKQASVLSDMIQYGWKAQLANVLQFFNYRMSHYILEGFFGRAMLGIFSAGVQLSEGLWIVGKSVSMVQFSKTVNVTDKVYAKTLAVNLVKLTFVLTLLMLVVVLLLPENVFLLLFGEEFTGIKTVIISLAPGIVIVPCSMVLSAYFSGTGRPQISAIGSATGLVATLAVGFSIIPLYGLVAAGITSSVTYLVIAAYLFNRFLKLSGAKKEEFYFRKRDYYFLKKEIQAVIKPQKQK